MRLAIAQMKTRAGDFEKTAERMADYARRAADQGVDLLVFPTTTLCGATPVRGVDREGFMLDLADCVMDLAEELACPCLVPVLTELGGVTTPDALLIDNGDINPVCLRTRFEAMTSGAAGEQRAGLPEVEFAGARLGVAFTYEDLDDYDEYEYNVDVVLFLSGYGFAVDDPSSALGSSLAEGRFLADAEATGAWMVGVGPIGCYDLQVFCGSSFVLAPWGELAAQAPSLEEALLVCDIDPSAEGPLAEPLTPEVYDAPLMTWGAITTGLLDTCERLQASGACLLVDGSLSSALLATLATDALGPERVYLLVFAPDEKDARVAERLARTLRIPQDHVETLELPGEKDGWLARGVAQARLSALAHAEGCLALGSADKTGRALELACDVDAAGLNPFGDLYRSDLIALAHLRNTISPVIPPEVLDKVSVPEIDGLSSEFSSDEGRLAFVDLVLSSYIEWELSLSDIAAERGHAELAAAIVGRMRACGDVPRQLGAPSLMVSSKTLGESHAPYGLAWVDSVRPQEARLQSRLEALVTPEERADEPQEMPPTNLDHDREVRDLLGYLRDFSAGGGFSPLGGASLQAGQGGRHEEGPTAAPTFWEGPFSEN